MTLPEMEWMVGCGCLCISFIDIAPRADSFTPSSMRPWRRRSACGRSGSQFAIEHDEREAFGFFRRDVESPAVEKPRNEQGDRLLPNEWANLRPGHLNLKLSRLSWSTVWQPISFMSRSISARRFPSALSTPA